MWHLDSLGPADVFSGEKVQVNQNQRDFPSLGNLFGLHSPTRVKSPEFVLDMGKEPFDLSSLSLKVWSFGVSDNPRDPSNSFVVDDLHAWQTERPIASKCNLWKCSSFCFIDRAQSLFFKEYFTDAFHIFQTGEQFC